MYRQIYEKIQNNPIPGVEWSNFVGIQEYKRQMGLPTVDNPEIIKEFLEETQSASTASTSATLTPEQQSVPQASPETCAPTT